MTLRDEGVECDFSYFDYSVHTKGNSDPKDLLTAYANIEGSLKVQGLDKLKIIKIEVTKEIKTG